MRTAITEALMTLTSAVPGAHPIAWENVIFDPAPSSLYLRAALLPATEDAENITASQLYSVAIGVWQVLVIGSGAAAPQQGPGEVNAVVDVVKTTFRPGMILPAPTSDPTVTVRLEATSDAPAVPGVSRYQVPVSITYRAARLH